MVTPEAIAAELDAEERVLLFCVASGTPWARSGVKARTVQLADVRGLVDRVRGTQQLALTNLGRAVLNVLIRPEEGGGGPPPGPTPMRRRPARR
jgi:hypothetical protein